MGAVKTLCYPIWFQSPEKCYPIWVHINERLNQFMNKAAKESVYNVYVELANDQVR